MVVDWDNYRSIWFMTPKITKEDVFFYRQTMRCVCPNVNSYARLFFSSRYLASCDGSKENRYAGIHEEKVSGLLSLLSQFDLRARRLRIISSEVIFDTIFQIRTFMFENLLNSAVMNTNACICIWQTYLRPPLSFYMDCMICQAFFFFFIFT